MKYRITVKSQIAHRSTETPDVEYTTDIYVPDNAIVSVPEWTALSESQALVSMVYAVPVEGK